MLKCDYGKYRKNTKWKAEKVIEFLGQFLKDNDYGIIVEKKEVDTVTAIKDMIEACGVQVGDFIRTCVIVDGGQDTFLMEQKTVVGGKVVKLSENIIGVQLIKSYNIETKKYALGQAFGYYQLLNIAQITILDPEEF